MIIVSRIIHVKVDRRLNVTNKFKYQRRLSIRLAIVMFRGTPCIKIYICYIIQTKIKHLSHSSHGLVENFTWKYSSYFLDPNPLPHFPCLEHFHLTFEIVSLTISFKIVYLFVKLCNTVGVHHMIRW